MILKDFTIKMYCLISKDFIIKWLKKTKKQQLQG